MTPIIGLVQGDACGIGPELAAKLVCMEEATEQARVVVFSDRRVFEAGCVVAGVTPDIRVVESLDDAEFTDGRVTLLDIPCLDPAEITPGRVSEAAGSAVLECLGQALDAAMAGRIDGVCFVPFNKVALHLAGMGCNDELTWAKARLGYDGPSGEFNVVRGMWNARVTSHVPLKDVAGLLSEDRIVDAIDLADRTLKQAGFRRPRIAVAALNPHAGEDGMIGREEIDIIRPAVERAQAQQVAAEGPFPSDTLFLKVRDGEFDCAVSMYHDQGQIAIKLLGFDEGVSVLGGLPVPVTTPAHGTAFDIVGRNVANPEPARLALRMIIQMARRRSEPTA